ncbi:glycoside hydrolase family 27 protein [Gaetbulibacter sp. M240]|uniref:glycoside hydrolase family 27 protein n=1 Tax=Gaetbulibacter sp. M240 TaxID=3126511 RepID=UPI00374FA067
MIHYKPQKGLVLTIAFVIILAFQSCKKTQGESGAETLNISNNFKEWAKTPPMGWNSWDCYGPTVKENEVLDNARYMADNLKDFGWEYVVVDIRWYVENTKSHGYNQTNPVYVIDAYGRYLPAIKRFPSAEKGKGFKALADKIHNMGLKFGIHLMRGIPKYAVEHKLPIKGTSGITADQIYSEDNQCKWLKDNYTIDANKPGAQEYYNSLFDMYAAWGVDFVKIDDLSAPMYHKNEIELIRKAIDQCGRKIVLSTSPGETPVADAVHVNEHANMWRMVNDVWDSWWHIRHLMEVSQSWYGYNKNGTWPDCDMIPLGRLSIRGERGDDRMTQLTKDEQYTLMTFFTIFKSPLFFGGDLPSNDAFTNALLTNKEVLKMHSEGSEVRQVFMNDGKLAITSKNKKEDVTYLALFNIGDKDSLNISVDLKDLSLPNKVNITNMWNNKTSVLENGTVEKILAPHASILYKIHDLIK